MTGGVRFGKWLLAGAVALVGVGASMTTAASVPPSALPQVAPVRGGDVFTGEIVIHGCQVAAADLQVRARPIHPPNPAQPGVTDITGRVGVPIVGPPHPAGTEIGPMPNAGNRSQVVRVRSIGSGRFEFAFQGLAPLTPYRVGVKLTGQSRQNCEQMVWDVSRDPLFMGGDETITFELYTVHSRLEVLGASGRGREKPTWVAADLVDFDDPVAAVRQFRWRTSVPGANGGLMQVSVAPFPRVADERRAGGPFNPCAEDTTKIAWQQWFAAVPGQWTTIPVDFKAIVPGPGRTGTPGVRVDDSETGPSPSSAIDAHMAAKLEMGHPLYVRVVPTIDGRPVCDGERGVPGEALIARKIKQILDQLGQPQFEITEIWYDKPFIHPRPKQGETCYRVTQDHKIPPIAFASVWERSVAQHMSGVTYGQTASSVFPNNLFCVPAQDDDDGWFESFISDLGAVLTGLVDEIAKLINSASELWEKIQDYAVKAVAKGLEGLGVPCPPKPCQAALEAGLGIALATMGVPPSIPNFDDLMDQGFDYIAAQAASQAGLSGVGGVLADYASDQMQEFTKKAVKDMQDRPYNIPKLPGWLVPDIRFSPAVLTLHLRRTQGSTTPFTSRPAILRDNDPIYYGRFALLPTNLPLYNADPAKQQYLKYPMVLEPNLNNLPTAPSSKCSSQQFSYFQKWFGAGAAASICNTTAYESAVWDKNKWVEMKYKNGCYQLRLTGLSSIGDHVFVMREHAFRTEDATQGCTPK